MPRPQRSRQHIDLSKLGPSAQAQLQALGITAAKTRNKYGVSAPEQRTVDGIQFASKKEALFFVELCRTLGRDKIARQPRYTLQEAFTGPDGTRHREIAYVADFLITTPDGQQSVCDVKGALTEIFKLKHKLFVNRYKQVLHQFQNLGQLHEFLVQHGVQLK